MKNITNAAPGLVNYGVEDRSVAPYTRTPELLPQHLPKWLIYAVKGPSVLDDNPRQLLGGNERQIMYGDETFIPTSKYFTHQALYSNGVNAVGNQCIYVRLLGRNHGPKPTIRVWLDVLDTTVDLYERNPDGSLKLNTIGEPKVIGTASGGLMVKHVVDYIGSDANKNKFGTLDPMEGDQVDAATGAKSTRYPLFELRHNFYGEDGNLAGIRLWGQSIENTGNLPERMIARERAFPYSFGVVRKNTTTGNSKFQKTIYQEQFITVTLKKDVTDPQTAQRLYFGERAIDDFQNVQDTRYPIKFGEFGEFHIYQDNIDTLQRKFQLAELPYAPKDFGADVADQYMVNIVNATDTRGNPYNAIVLVDSANSVRWSQDTNVFAKGGDDGEMTAEAFAQDAAEYMAGYADPDSELQDDAYNVESHFYDSGFPLDYKYEMIKFIAERKDTFIHLTPFEFGQRKLTQGEEASVARSLMSRLSMYPESLHFGTPVYRGLVQGCTGKIRNSLYTGHVSVNYEIAVKSAKYMGAGDGRFKHAFRFEGYPGHILDLMYDFSYVWVPESVRIRNWDSGLNWVSRFDTKQFYFPAFKTVYNEDTSVLTGYITSCIFLTCNKALAKCQRVFTGRSDLTMPQFSKAVNDWLIAELSDKFDDRVIIRPKAQFTSLDQVRNFSWTVPLEIGAVGMKTVMTGYAVARRYEEMAAESI